MDDTPTDDDTRTRPTGDDEGKDVIDASGERIGEVSEHRGDTIVVEADPSITDQIKSVLGWGETDDAYRIDEGQIDRISDNAVHVRTTEGEEPGGRAGASDAGASETTPSGAATEAGRTTTSADERSGTGRPTTEDDRTGSADTETSEDIPGSGETTQGDDITGTGDRTTDEGSHGDAGHHEDTGHDDPGRRDRGGDDEAGITDDELREAGQSERGEGVPEDERRLTDDDADDARDDSDDGILGDDDDDDDSDEGLLSDDDRDNDDRDESGTR